MRNWKRKENMLNIRSSARQIYITDEKNANRTKSSFQYQYTNPAKITYNYSNEFKNCKSRGATRNIIPNCTVHIKDIPNTWNDTYKALSVQFWNFVREYNGLPQPSDTYTLSNIIADYFRGLDPELQKRNFNFICDNAVVFNNIDSNFSALWNIVDSNDENWGSLYSTFDASFWSWLVCESPTNAKNICNILDNQSFPTRDEMRSLYYAYVYIYPNAHTNAHTKSRSTRNMLTNVTVEIQVGYNTHTPVSVNFQLTSLNDINVTKLNTNLDSDTSATSVLSSIDADIALVETARNNVMSIDRSVASWIDVSNNFIAKYDADIEKWKHDSIESASEKMSSLSDQLELLAIYMDDNESIY